MMLPITSWVCYITQPHREKLAKASLQEKSSEVFLPLCVNMVKINNKYAQSIRPFSHDIYLRDIYGSKRLNGVSGFVCSSLDRSLFDDKIINIIKEKKDDRGMVLINNNKLIVGQSVKIQEGTLTGFEAIYS